MRIERKAYVRAGQCIVVTNRPSQIEQCSKRIEKDRLNHSSQTFNSKEIASKRPNRPHDYRQSSSASKDREQASKPEMILEEKCHLTQVRAGLDDVCHNLVMLPVKHNDPINAKILAISEDKIEGFVREPFEEIAN